MGSASIEDNVPWEYWILLGSFRMFFCFQVIYWNNFWNLSRPFSAQVVYALCEGLWGKSELCKIGEYCDIVVESSNFLLTVFQATIVSLMSKFCFNSAGRCVGGEWISVERVHGWVMSCSSCILEYLDISAIQSMECLNRHVMLYKYMFGIFTPPSVLRSHNFFIAVLGSEFFHINYFSALFGLLISLRGITEGFSNPAFPLLSFL